MKILAFLLFLLMPAVASAADEIGVVSRIQGRAEGSSVDGTTRALETGAAVHLGEVIATGAATRIEMMFTDNTVLTVGENSRIVLDAFVFQPAGANTFRATIAGPFRYVSGKLAPGALREASIETPYAVIGVRGTDFWGGPLDGRFGVFLIKGQVSVTAAGREVVMGTPGQGVDIEAEGAPPGKIILWGQAKIDRAFASITFQ